MRSILQFLRITCLAAAIVLLLSAIAPAVAQFGLGSIDPQQVYAQFPDLPLENQYVSRETGEVAQNNTLVSRMVQYHLLVANRIPTSRLDWKLTMADYLDANEWMRSGLYPGAETLRPNPIEGDKAAIGRLNRAQRDALIDVLVSLFSVQQPP